MTTAGDIKLEQALEKAIGPLREQVQQIRAELKTLSQSFSVSTDMSQHPAGLCQETDCEICVTQGQQLTNDAFARGRAAMVNDIDEFLIQAGGEPLRERFAQAVMAGQNIAQEKGLIVADGDG